MEEVKVEKKDKVEKKNKHKKQQKKKNNILQVIGIIMFILVAIFIGNTIRKFYIFNTHMAATSEYSTKDNYKKIVVQYAEDELEFAIMGCKKGDKTLAKMYSEDNKKTVSYYDKQTKESIIKLDVEEDKIAIVNQTDTPTMFISLEGFTQMSAWQNFLLALQSNVISENYKGKECYKITTYGDLEQWVDKETGLVVRELSGYYQYSDGTKKRVYHEYTYQFGIVTDEDVAKPDLTGYKIQEN